MIILTTSVLLICSISTIWLSITQFALFYTFWRITLATLKLMNENFNFLFKNFIFGPIQDWQFTINSVSFQFSDDNDFQFASSYQVWSTKSLSWPQHWPATGKSQFINMICINMESFTTQEYFGYFLPLCVWNNSRVFDK